MVDSLIVRGPRAREGVLQSVWAVLEQLLWIMFLGLLIVSSFIPGRIDHPQWVQLSTAFLVLALLALPFGLGRMHHVSRNDVIKPIIILLTALGWVALVANIAIESPFHQKVYPLAGRPDWFAAEFVWAVLPNAASQVVMRDAMMLSVFTTVVILCRSRNRLKVLMLVFSALTLAHCLVSLAAWQASTHLVDVQQIDGHFSAMRGLFVNRNHFASFLIIGSLGSWIALFYGIHKLNGQPLSVWIARLGLSALALHVLLLGLVFFCVVMSESRAGFATFLLVFLLLVMRAIPHQSTSQSNNQNDKHNVRRKHRRLLSPRVLVSLFFVLLALLAVLLYADGLGGRLATMQGLLGERPLQWWITTQAIMDQPWVGYGAGSYSVVFEYYRQGFELRDVIFDQAHNDWIQLVLEQGIIGLVLWLSFFYVVLSSLLRYLRYTPSRYRRAVLYAVSAIVMAAVLQSMVDFNLQIVRIRLLFFVSLAVVFVLAQNDHQHTKHRSA